MLSTPRASFGADGNGAVIQKVSTVDRSGASVLCKIVLYKIHV